MDELVASDCVNRIRCVDPHRRRHCSTIAVVILLVIYVIAPRGHHRGPQPLAVGLDDGAFEEQTRLVMRDGLHGEQHGRTHSAAVATLEGNDDYKHGDDDDIGGRDGGDGDWQSERQSLGRQ